MFQILNSFASKLLPSWLPEKLIGSWDPQGFEKYFKNTGWIFFARLFSYVLSFFTIALVARYLGPENLGKISYAQSFTLLFSVLASLGIDQILYRDLVDTPENKDELLGTAFISKFVLGFFAVFFTISTAYFLNEEPLLIWLIGLISLTFIFQPLSVVTLLLNARVQSKYASYATIVIAIIIAVAKMLVIYFDKGVLFFALIILLEAILYALFNLYFYIKIVKEDFFQWKFSLATFVTLIKRSLPLVLATLSGYIYLRIDQVMILHFIDSTSVGLYEAAVRLTELLNFLPLIIISSLFPALINARKNDLKQFHNRFFSLMKLCLGISFVSAFVLYAISPFAVLLIFGGEYQQTIILTKIYAWVSIGTISTVLMQQYLIAENRTSVFLFITASGAILNVILNIFMIPALGLYGAAYATLITLTSIILIFGLLKKVKYI